MFDIRLLLQAVHGMVRRTVAFDVDGTLIDVLEQPRWPVIDLLRAFHALGWSIGVWSGGGPGYAKHWVQRLGLVEFVDWHGMKTKNIRVDIAIDDMEGTDLAAIATIIV